MKNLSLLNVVYKFKYCFMKEKESKINFIGSVTYIYWPVNIYKLIIYNSID